MIGLLNQGPEGKLLRDMDGNIKYLSGKIFCFLDEKWLTVIYLGPYYVSLGMVKDQRLTV